MESVKPRDIFLANCDPAVGAEASKKRPALVVSNDLNHTHSPIVSIAPITSNVIRVYSFEVEVPAGTGGLRSRSKIMVNQTRAVDKVRLLRNVGHLPDSIMADVDKALRVHFDL